MARYSVHNLALPNFFSFSENNSPIPLTLYYFYVTYQKVNLERGGITKKDKDEKQGFFAKLQKIPWSQYENPICFAVGYIALTVGLFLRLEFGIALILFGIPLTILAVSVAVFEKYADFTLRRDQMQFKATVETQKQIKKIDAF